MLHTPKLLRPLAAAFIHMQWYMESHNLRLATHSLRDMHPAPVAFESVRKFNEAHASIALPDASFINKEGRLIYQKCRPTDAVAMRMFASGYVNLNAWNDKKLPTAIPTSKDQSRLSFGLFILTVEADKLKSTKQCFHGTRIYRCL